jgi:hypothetical protein
MANQIAVSIEQPWSTIDVHVEAMFLENFSALLIHLDTYGCIM